MAGYDEAAAVRVCAVCAREFAKYTCPRCAVQYCALACYKAHDGGCAEAFHREHAESELRSKSASPEARSEMASLLRRLRERTLDDELDGTEPPAAAGDDDADDPREELDAASTRRVRQLQAAATRGDVDATALTEEELRDFERQLANGSLVKHLELPEPWWSGLTPRSIRRLPDGTFECLGARVPPVVPQLPPLRSLTSRAPPRALAYVALELLLAYAYLYRLFDCEPSADVADASACALQLSAALAGTERGTFPDASAALDSVFTRCAHPLTKTSRAFSKASFSDARALLGAPGTVAFALSDLHAILRAHCTAQTQAQTQSQSRGGARSRGATRAIELATRKALFVTSWWCSRPTADLIAACAELGAAMDAHVDAQGASELQEHATVTGHGIARHIHSRATLSVGHSPRARPRARWRDAGPARQACD
jgi:hypothetical protein